MSRAEGKAEVVRVLIDHRRARYEYHLHDVFEAGLVLVGSEVKSLRAGNANIAEAWIGVDAGGAWLHGCHIAPYVEANRQNHEPLRKRRLLLHQAEITKLRRGTTQGGMTIIPLRLYLKGSRIKLEIALAKGKKLHDKRETVKEREARREIARNR